MIKTMACLGTLAACLATASFGHAKETGGGFSSYLWRYEYRIAHDFNMPFKKIAGRNLVGIGRELQFDPSAKKTADTRVTSGKVKIGTPYKTAAFGSTPIPFRQIALREKWERSFSQIENYSAPSCDESLPKCTINTKVLRQTMNRGRDKSFFQKLSLANGTVNELISYRSDKRAYRKLDYWANPSESLGRGYGDCEDYVILKMALLSGMGVPTNSMSMIVVKDMQRDLYHAVLAIRTNRGTLILDNLNENVIADHQVKQYLPLFSFSEEKSWIHGWHKENPKRFLAKRAFSDIRGVLPGGSGNTKSISLRGVSNSELERLVPKSWAL
ncbi:MAG: transglutaminase-like cysteine peptidase [Rhizobiaceae bacterium]